MAKSNPFQAWEDYYELAHKWRGQIIDRCITMEQSMELFIARYFIREMTTEAYERKVADFRRLFFWNTQMGLTRKKHILIDLINSYSPEFQQIHPDISTELDKVIKCRNSMAHWQLDFGRTYRWYGARDRNIKVNRINQADTTIFTEPYIKEITDLCIKYTNVLYWWVD